MKITATSDEKPYHLILHLDGEPWHRVHMGIFGRNPTFSTNDRDEAEERYAALLRQGAKRFILRRLTKRSYYSGELREALTTRLVPMAIIDELIQSFSSLGYIDDEAYIDALVCRLQRQKCGPRAIAQKLHFLGVPKSLSSTAINKHCGKEAQSSNIQRLLATRYRSRDLSLPKERQKVVAALMRKGYSLDEIFAELKF